MLQAVALALKHTYAGLREVLRASAGVPPADVVTCGATAVC